MSKKIELDWHTCLSKAMVKHLIAAGSLITTLLKEIESQPLSSSFQSFQFASKL